MRYIFLSLIIFSILQLSCMNTVPSDLFPTITRHLDISSINNFSKTCKLYNSFVLKAHIKNTVITSQLKKNLYLDCLIHYSKNNDYNMMKHLITHDTKHEKIRKSIMYSFNRKSPYKKSKNFPINRYMKVFSGNQAPQSLKTCKKKFYGFQLLQASCIGKNDIVKFILKVYPDLVSTVNPNGDSPLHLACIEPHYIPREQKIKTVKLLLKKGADSSIQNKNGKIPADFITPQYRYTPILKDLGLWVSFITIQVLLIWQMIKISIDLTTHNKF